MVGKISMELSNFGSRDTYRSFECELQDLYPSNREWTRVKCFYENGELLPQPIMDEFGREWSLSELSIFDHNILQNHLAFHLGMNEQNELEEKC